MTKMSLTSKIFNFLIVIFLSLLGILCVLPLVHILAVSLSENYAVTAHTVKLWPVGFNTLAYEKSLSSTAFLTATKVSVVRALLGTTVSMVLTLMAAYSMSKDDGRFKARGYYVWFFVFTMLFNGGLIPTYLVVKMTGLIDKIWALILPGAVNVFNIVVLMNFFRGIPKDYEEAAFIDGAGHFTILFKLYLPISLPSISTLSLFTIISHWNSWFDGMIYMTQITNYPLATFLRSLINSFDYTKIGQDPSILKYLSERALKAAQMFIGMLPILLVYPFLQKYFVKGLTLGQ